MFRNYRWTVLLMLFFAMVINYIDRAAISVAMPFISERFQLDPTQKGMIFSSFFIGYALFNFIGGYLSDRMGPKKVFSWSMLIWSLFCGLTALAFNFWSLFIIRFFFGIGEGPIGSTANKTVNNWFPVKERARAVGINQAGGPLGGALAGPVVGFMAIYLGWEYAFLVLAVIGIMWMIAWNQMFVDDPVKHPKVAKKELEKILEGRESSPTQARITGAKLSLFEILKQPAVLVTGVSLFCFNYILFFFLTWFPTYLTDAKNLSIAEMSIVTSIPWLVGALGYTFGGVLIDTIYKLTGRQLFSRKIVLVICLLSASICIGWSGLTDSVFEAVAFMTVGIGFMYLTAPAYWAIIQDSVSSENVGSASGFMHAMGNISGIIGPTVTGFMIQLTNSYSSAFILAGVLGLWGALSVAFCIKSSSIPK
ncbi:MFS transporter [Ammoniphilus sp. 3BR4]|uniref:MFS transporter n=1 Tax=Ammoniphilus sp. 3BR4 TaxID=3158265 RepID=UPI0034665F5D